MTPASAKQKGRALQQFVRDLIVSTFKLHEDDVRSTSMGACGEDILMSPAAQKHFPYTIECKNVEKLNVWEAYEQACSHGSKREPLLVMKKNRKKPLAVVDLAYFMSLHKDKK